MPGYHLSSPQDRTAWLLGIGRRLRAEYNVLLAAPLPPRLAVLVRQLENSAKASGQDCAKSVKSAEHQTHARGSASQERPDQRHL